MSVPADIRAVPRPKNTIVDDNGRDTPFRYAVRERGSTKYVPGHNPQPRNGKVIGHIIDHKFVPLQKSKPIKPMPTELSYGTAATARSLSEDLLKDLRSVFTPSDANAIMAAAILRIICPSLSPDRMSVYYYRTYVCKFYPGLKLSESSVKKLFTRIGTDQDRRRAFYQRRIESMAEGHHVMIDGISLQGGRKSKNLLAYPYREKSENNREASILYGYDMEQAEPLCMEVIPGSRFIPGQFSVFIDDMGLEKAVIGNGTRKDLREFPKLHYFISFKQKEKEAARYAGQLDSTSGTAGEKVRTEDGKFLYIRVEVQDKKDHSNPPAESRKNETGYSTLTLESDLDIEIEEAYRCYEDRQFMRRIFRYTSCIPNTELSTGDCAVTGSDFVNFISSIITCRIIHKAEQSGLLKDMSYGDLIEDMNAAWRTADAPENPTSGDVGWINVSDRVMKEMELLGISTPVPLSELKRKGRKPKIKEPEEDRPKRPRGRPKKDPSAVLEPNKI